MNTPASAITEKMRDRLPKADRRRLVFCEIVVAELFKLRMEVSDDAKREVDKAALDHAEKMLKNTVERCKRLLDAMPPEAAQ